MISGIRIHQRYPTIRSVADLREAHLPRAPSGPNFLHFQVVFGKNWPNNRLAPPPLELAPPPLGNPGSATEGNTVLQTLRRFPFFKVFWSSFFLNENFLFKRKRIESTIFLPFLTSMYKTAAPRSTSKV